MSARSIIFQASKRYIAEPPDAICFAPHVVSLLVEKRSLLITSACLIKVPAIERDIAESENTIGLSLHVANVMVD